jgi:hypothetical protein
MHILEGYGDDISPYIEHITHRFECLLIVTFADIYECGEEDISDLI